MTSLFFREVNLHEVLDFLGEACEVKIGEVQHRTGVVIRYPQKIY
jgi:hypothetical protein